MSSHGHTPNHFGTAQVRVGGYDTYFDTLTSLATDLDDSWTIVSVDFDDEHRLVDHAAVRFNRRTDAGPLSIVLEVALPDLPRVEMLVEFDDDDGIIIRVPTPAAVSKAVNADALDVVSDRSIRIDA